MRFIARCAFIAGCLTGGTLLAQPADAIELGYFANGAFGDYRFQTSVVVQNQETTGAALQIRFRDPAGGPMEGMTLQSKARHGQSHHSGNNGEISGLSLGPGAFRNFESPGEGPLQIGSCSVQSTARIQAHLRVRLFDQEGSLVTEVHILPSGASHSFRFFLGDMDPKNVGASFTNPNGDRGTTCVLQLYETVDGPGNDAALLESDGVTLVVGAHAQVTKLLRELFELQYEQSLVDFLSDPDRGDVYAVVTCEDPICATVLHLNGLEYLGIPVYSLDPDAGN